MAIRVSALIAVALSYALYIPLPAENGLDRIKVQMSEIGMRVAYFYPMNALKSLGVDWQVWWARKSLGLLIKTLRLRLLIQSQDGLRISHANFDGVPVIVYEPEHRHSNGAIVLIHGGGFVLMDAETYDQLAREFAITAGVAVFSLDYRLAPEHIFPTALDDCEKAIAYLLNIAYQKYSIDPNRVAIIGDSAGGNLAAGSALRLIDKSTQMAKPKLQVLMYPLLQFIDFRTPSYQEAGILYGGTALADPESIARWFALYLGLSGTEAEIFLRNDHIRRESIKRRAPFLLQDMIYTDLPFNVSEDHVFDASYTMAHHVEPSLANADRSSTTIKERMITNWKNKEILRQLRRKLETFLFNPELSPMMRKDLSKSPKTYLMTCQYDPLRDEGYWYGKRLKKAGVDVTWRHYDKAFHAIINLHGELDLADRMLKDVIKFLHENL